MYVLIGGFRAVALSDTLLGIIMLVGTTIILIATVIAGGGIEKIMQELVQINPNLITPFGADGSLTKTYVTSFWILIELALSVYRKLVCVPCLIKFKSDASSVNNWDDCCGYNYDWYAFNGCVRTSCTSRYNGTR